MLSPDLVELSTILSSSDPEILSDDTLWNSAVCLLLYPKDGDYIAAKKFKDFSERIN